MNEPNKTAAKDLWDKFAISSGFVAAVFVPLALGLAGHWYTDAISERESILKEREFARQWVQIALGILSNEQVADDERLRQWAIDVINFYVDEKI